MAVEELFTQKSFIGGDINLEEISWVEGGERAGKPYLQIHSYRRKYTLTGQQRKHENFAYIELPDWKIIEELLNHIDLRLSSERRGTYSKEISPATGIFANERHNDAPVDRVEFCIEDLFVSMQCWNGDQHLGAVTIPIPEKVEDSEIQDENLLKETKAILEDLAQLEPSQPINRKSPADGTNYDFFISHSSKDKDDLVRPLYEELTERDFQVWFDESEISGSDVIVREIDRGLAKSNYGVVILSPDFIDSEWAKAEFYALLTLHIKHEDVLIPIRHRISIDDLEEFSPLLASQPIASTEGRSVRDIADEIERSIS